MKKGMSDEPITPIGDSQRQAVTADKKQPALPRCSASQGPVSRRLKWKRLLAYIVVLLYVVTWVGGWISHDRAVKARAEDSYERTKLLFQAVERLARESREDVNSLNELKEYHAMRLYKDGP